MDKETGISGGKKVHIELDKKVLGGKYVKVEVELENGIIDNVIISGDFFAFPIEEFENFLTSLRGIKFSREQINSVFKKFSDKITFSGIAFDDLLEIFTQLLNKKDLA